jgi:2-polyprenyl-3-methyl-5-hydroxy-6-metoxy-1,4-benzoquinol methylase
VFSPRHRASGIGGANVSKKRKVFMRLRFAKALVGVLALGITTASAGPLSAAKAASAQEGLRQPDVIYVPTRQSVVDAMLKVANVKAGDVLYDLGCGDGRIPVTAAKLGARAVCIDIDPRRIVEANENVKKNNVGDRVRVLNQDLFTTDISEATVVSLYLLPSLNLKLRPTLWKTLKPGTRIVSHDFDMGDWKPEQTLNVDGATVYYWTITPDLAKKAAAETK